MNRKPNEWDVWLSLDPSEKDAIEEVVFRVLSGQRTEVSTDFTEAGAVSHVTMWVTVPADSAQKAMDEAAKRYQRVRQAARLSDEPARIIGVFPVGARRGDQLMAEASKLLTAGHREMAVVAMQTACELLAKDVLETLAARAGVSKKALRTPVTLQDHPTRAILFLATGKRIERQHWWRDYVAHLERRSGVVHDGLTVPQKQAKESWEAAEAFRAYVRAQVDQGDSGA
jgi:hypothetical protein